VTHFNESQNRALATLFVSDGWKLIKQDFLARQEVLKHKLIYGTDRSKDDILRASISAIDMILRLENDIFAPPEQDATPFELPVVPQTRYE